MHVTPTDLVRDAIRQGGRVIVSTYNEPLITSEWAVAVFKEARAAGLITGFVSNGNGTPQVLEYLRPWVELYKVDLKSFDDRTIVSSADAYSRSWIPFDSCTRWAFC